MQLEVGVDPQQIDPNIVETAERRGNAFWDVLEFFTLPLDLVDIVWTFGRLLWSVGRLVVWVIGGILEVITSIGDLFS
jgi:hypothetical protein